MPFRLFRAKTKGLVEEACEGVKDYWKNPIEDGCGNDIYLMASGADTEKQPQRYYYVFLFWLMLSKK